MSYMEEIFQRSEKQFKDIPNMLAWLSSFERPERGANAYTKDAIKVRDELGRLDVIKTDIEEADALPKLKTFKEEVGSLPRYLKDYKSELTNLANIRTKELEIAEEMTKEFEKEAKEIQAKRRKR